MHKGGTNVNSGCICMRMCNICTFIAGVIEVFNYSLKNITRMLRLFFTTHIDYYKSY